ncbi:PQQ-binding-like beta-propeller repeat protein [Kitasatospora sp. NPDC096128]|uniref:outer membrane protein assembly factor BamB family protein n=1 Tax=Kitasatospora sp. NPDC096128 TaxID=3155547 RepID=UPI00332308FF
MKSSEGPVQEASWQWDGDADSAAEAPGDVLDGGGGGGPRLSRRGLLIGAGVLAAGGAVWALGRAGADGPTPSPSPSKPQPTALSGPTPLWTYRGAQAMTPERLIDPPPRPVFLSRAGLQVLDPAGGAARRLVVFDPPRPANWPSDNEAPGGKVVVGPEYLFSAESKGHLDAHHLTDPAGDWSLPMPDDLQGEVHLVCADGDVLYGYAWSRSDADGIVLRTRVFAVRVSDRSVLWSAGGDQQEHPVAVAGTGTRLLVCTRSNGSRAELVVRDAATGREQWTTPGAQDLSWCTPVGTTFLVPDGTGGVRRMGPGGETLWTHAPARGESWQALPPVPDAVRVFVPRNNGVVTCLETSTGTVLWSCKLPFLLDRRSRPLVDNGTLYVPGPSAGGVSAVYAATGRLGWTFHDSGPGKDVWSVSTDGSRLYAGHDDVLHALPLS